MNPSTWDDYIGPLANQTLSRKSWNSAQSIPKRSEMKWNKDKISCHWFNGDIEHRPPNTITDTQVPPSILSWPQHQSSYWMPNIPEIQESHAMVWCTTWWHKHDGGLLDNHIAFEHYEVHFKAIDGSCYSWFGQLLLILTPSTLGFLTLSSSSSSVRLPSPAVSIGNSSIHMLSSTTSGRTSITLPFWTDLSDQMGATLVSQALNQEVNIRLAGNLDQIQKILVKTMNPHYSVSWSCWLIRMPLLSSFSPSLCSKELHSYRAMSNHTRWTCQLAPQWYMSLCVSSREWSQCHLLAGCDHGIN